MFLSFMNGWKNCVNAPSYPICNILNFNSVLSCPDFNNQAHTGALSVVVRLT